MQNGILTLDWESVKSAVISTVLMAVLAVLVYIVGVGDIFHLNISTIANIGAMSLATGFISLLKNFLTTSDGKFLGMTQTS